MKSASFTGIYSIREIGCFPELQTNVFSGVCYAWKKEDDVYIVLPIGEDNTPHGNCYLLDARDFEFLFQEYTAKTSPSGFALRPPLRSDSPDLLGMWYEESLAAGTSDREPCSFRQTEFPLNAGGLPFAPIADDEARFAPAWHPDEMLRALEDADPQAVAHISVPPAAAEPTGLLPPLFNLAPQASPSESEPSPASSVTPAPLVQVFVDEEEREEDEASRSARLEQRMRAKFEILLHQMDENAAPESEEELSRLLTLGSTFSWKQKFMFTEFGLALRRKQKLVLALRSHLRALALAPNDEHILFNVARAEYELGNTNAARQYLDKALAVAPDFTIARNFQSFLLGRA